MIRPLPLRPHVAAGCSRQLCLQGGEFVSVLVLQRYGGCERGYWLLRGVNSRVSITRRALP